MSEVDSVCVVTHPLGGAGENATRSLLDILTAVTPVSLVAAGIAPDSPLRDRTDLDGLDDVSVGSPADSIHVAAVQFVLHQVRLSAAIARHEESVVLFYGATSYLLPICTAKALGRTVVLEPRGDVPLTLRLHWEERLPSAAARLLAGSVRALERIGYRLADGIVTYTPSMAAELGLASYDSKLYTDGARYVDVDRFEPSVPFEERERVVGFLGRLDEEKGIRTLARVARRFPDDVTFVFAGDGALSGWLADELEAERRAGEVELAGWVDHEDVPAVLNRFRLLVMPSQPTEGLPTAILEAFGCGTPVYATPVAGVPDVVREGETGFTMDEIAEESIVDDVTGILSRADMPEISRNCRELVASEYSFDAAVERYRRILEAVN